MISLQKFPILIKHHYNSSPSPSSIYLSGEINMPSSPLNSALSTLHTHREHEDDIEDIKSEISVGTGIDENFYHKCFLEWLAVAHETILMVLYKNDSTLQIARKLRPEFRMIFRVSNPDDGCDLIRRHNSDQDRPGIQILILDATHDFVDMLAFLQQRSKDPKTKQFAMISKILLLPQHVPDGLLNAIESAGGVDIMLPFNRSTKMVLTKILETIHQCRSIESAYADLRQTAISVKYPHLAIFPSHHEDTENCSDSDVDSSADEDVGAESLTVEGSHNSIPEFSTSLSIGDDSWTASSSFLPDFIKSSRDKTGANNQSSDDKMADWRHADSRTRRKIDVIGKRLIEEETLEPIQGKKKRELSLGRSHFLASSSSKQASALPGSRNSLSRRMSLMDTIDLQDRKGKQVEVDFFVNSSKRQLDVSKKRESIGGMDMRAAEFVKNFVEKPTSKSLAITKEEKKASRDKRLKNVQDVMHFLNSSKQSAADNVLILKQQESKKMQRGLK